MDAAAQATTRSTATSASKHEIPTTPLRYLFFISQRNRFLAGLAFALAFVGGLASQFAPYAIKKLIDSTSILAESSFDSTPWIWAGVFFVLFTVSEFFWRGSGFAGLVAATRTKSNSYKLFFRFLSDSGYNDEPGVIAHKIVLVSEGTAKILQEFLWSYLGVGFRIVVGVGLAFSAHPLFFGVMLLWALLHILSTAFVARFKQKFTRLVAQAVSELQGGLVNFCRKLIYDPSSITNQLNENIYLLYQLVDLREQKHQLDWKISEMIRLFFNVLHALFIGVIMIGILLLWQDRSITGGDVAMLIAIIRSVQFGLSQLSTKAVELYNIQAEVSEGLEYMHRKGPRALQAPKVIW